MKTFFISGHTNLSDEEFKLHYVPRLNQIIELAKSNADEKPVAVVIGNAWGADKMAFDYLVINNFPKNLITIYHYGSGVSEDYYGFFLGTEVISGFKSYTNRDKFMTENSDEDILWVRSDEETKKLVESQGNVFRKRVSGTELNKQRREKMKKSNIKQ